MPSTIHRFTPPTCTLEITGRKSPLSRWTNGDILQKIRFKLKFDDPRLTTSKEVTIQGDEQELLQLQTAIDKYVQTQLHSSFELVKTNLEIPKLTKVNEQLPYLKPEGLTHHELFFGSLSHDSDRQKVRLGTVQLFDLVTALEAYQNTVAVLPELQESKSELKIIPIWGKIAAVAIATASIATVVTVLKPQQQQNIASDRSQSESTAVIPELNEITPPNSPDPNSQPATPKLDEPIASANRLPPPPAVETPKPKPNIPDPANYSLPQVARQSGLENTAKQETFRQKQSQSERIEPEPEIPGAALPEQINPSATVQGSQKIETDEYLDRELNLQIEDAIQPDNELTATKSPIQLNQMQEVIAYFQNKWQPPTALQQSLEYRLFIAPDGSIERIVPLGKAARSYLSQTSIPVNGEPFVSPTPINQTVKIRLLLNPDGKVQAFTEE